MRKICFLSALLLVVSSAFAQDPPPPATDIVSNVQETAVPITNIQTPVAPAATAFSFEIGPFDYKSYSVNASGVQADLQRYDAQLRAKLALVPEGQMITIEGYADGSGPEQAVPGQEQLHPGNEYWSRMRAEAVRNYLMQKYNLPESRFQIVTYGGKKPKTGTDPRSSANRRVVVRWAPAS